MKDIIPKIVLSILLILYCVSVYMTKYKPVFFGYTCVIFLLGAVIIALKTFRHKF